jgi:hypothetical protein
LYWPPCFSFAMASEGNIIVFFFWACNTHTMEGSGVFGMLGRHGREREKKSGQSLARTMKKSRHAGYHAKGWEASFHLNETVFFGIKRFFSFFFFKLVPRYLFLLNLVLCSLTVLFLTNINLFILNFILDCIKMIP